MNTVRLDGESESVKSPVTGACTTRLAPAVWVGRPALPVPVTESEWLTVVAPVVVTVSVQVGFALVSGLAQPLNAEIRRRARVRHATLSPLPNEAFGVIVTV